MIRLLEGKKVQIAFFALLFAIEAVLALYTGLPYDMKVWFQTGQWFNQGINIYLPDNHIGYPPLWALWCSIAYAVYSFLGNNLEIWRLVLKLPIISSHLLLAFFVGKFAGAYAGPKTGNRMLVVILTWVFLVYVGALWGQINTISALLTFLAFEAMINQRTTRSAIFLGIAVTLKIFPLVTLPAFILYAWMKSGKKAVAKVTLWVVAIPITFTVLIFTIFRWDLLYFLETIFYWTPIYEITQAQIQGGGMNFWSFLGLFKIDVGNLWVLRLLWIPVLLGGFVWFWRNKLNWKIPDFNLAIITLYTLFIVSYGWATEQMFVDLLPFMLLQILVFNPKNSQFKFLIVIQSLIFAFSAANYGEFIFLPLLQQFFPSAEVALQIFVPATNPLVGAIRGVLGLVITLALLILFAKLLRNPKNQSSGSTKKGSCKDYAN